MNFSMVYMGQPVFSGAQGTVSNILDQRCSYITSISLYMRELHYWKLSNSPVGYGFFGFSVHIQKLVINVPVLKTLIEKYENQQKNYNLKAPLPLLCRSLWSALLVVIIIIMSLFFFFNTQLQT